jgi:hypothetical protein
MNAAEGKGAAGTATVVAINDIPALEAALAAARQRQDEELPARDLANAEAKLEKFRANLATVEAEVARLRAIVGGNPA